MTSDGKTTVEFTVYTVNDTEYITNEDAFKIYEWLYSVYPTKYIVSSYELQTTTDGQLELYRNAVVQIVKTVQDTTVVNHHLMNEEGMFISIQTAYPDGKLSENIDDITIHIEKSLAKKVARNDSALEGSKETTGTLTLYYRER